MAHPTEFATSGVSDALVILGAAGIVIPAFARFKVNPVIGFILVGLLVGPTGLGSLTDDYAWLRYITISNREAIEPFAEFGVILLLFSIGLELSFKRLWGMRRLVFGVGAAELLLGALFIGAGLFAFGYSTTASVALRRLRGAVEPDGDSVWREAAPRPVAQRFIQIARSCGHDIFRTPPIEREPEHPCKQYEAHAAQDVLDTSADFSA